MKFEIKEDGIVTIPITVNSKYIDYYKSLGQKVVQSSLDIEHFIKEIISNFLFQKNSNDPKFMKELFLDSSFCMFHTKIQILNRTLNHLNASTGKKRTKIQQLLSQVNKYRNMFAHGQISVKENLFYISYFEGEIKEKELTDEFWNSVEETLLEANELLNEFFIESFKLKAE
ncbi:hypothetical protein [Halarcobacter sp.]|uniref:hypothetical protein n=1 Tax=Halarcobacter sp. TaxID=2321133 RepID=UPI003B00CEED